MKTRTRRKCDKSNNIISDSEIKSEVDASVINNIEIDLINSSAIDVLESEQIDDTELIEDEHLVKLLDQEAEKTGAYSCEYCGRVFMHRRNVKPHIFKKHPLMIQKILLDTSNYFPCEICGRKFKYKKNLNAHIRGKHPEVSVQPFRRLEELKFPCDLCERKFKYRRNLYAHIRQIHFQGENPFARKIENANFVCDICNRGFLYKKNLVSHVRHKHLREEIVEETTVNEIGEFESLLDESHVEIDNAEKSSISPKKCPLCLFATSQKRSLLRHFTDIHNIQLDMMSLKFQNMDSFFKWKEEKETETSCKYIKTSCGKFQDHTTIIFHCHRSGRYKSKGTGCRFLKGQGSKKINAYCPAQMQVVEDEFGIKVRFTSTHVGHENELCHMFLKKEDREHIAEKLALGIPPEEILAEAGRSQGSRKRETFINLKDIHNIKTKYNLKVPEKQPDDHFGMMSVDDWVSAHQRDVRYYKKRGIVPPMETNLENEDFLLVFMNDLQREMLYEFGHNVICVHPIHNPQKYDFVWTTVMVLDEYSEGFPVAFLFSNRTDGEIYQIFFQCLADTVGPIQPDIFMSERDPDMYKSWAETMMPANRQLLCTWHVLRDWKKNIVTVKDEVKRKLTLKFLEMQVLREPNCEAFEDALNLFIDSRDDELNDFRKYFIANYLETIPSWAYCHRLETKINTNSAIEAFYRVLNFAAVKKGDSVTIEEALHTLHKYLVFKAKSREVTSMKQFKFSKKISEIRKQHKKSINTKYDASFIRTEEGWLMTAPAGDKESEMFMIREVDPLPCTNCKLVCSICDICIHRYACSCIDYSIKFTICEHIHYLCKLLQRPESLEIDHLVDESVVLGDFNIVIDDLS